MPSFIAAAFPPLGLCFNFKISPQISFIRVVCESRTRFSCGSNSSSGSNEALERQLLVFMKNSSNANEFPTKKQLLDAGRVDLVKAIAKTGGWLALGWDFSQHDDDDDDFSMNAIPKTGTSLRMLAEEDTGVEGILSRLEKHRSRSFGIHMEKNVHASGMDIGGFTIFNMSTDVAAKTDSQLQERQRHDNDDLKSDKIRFRLQQMQLELSSALHSLRSQTISLNPEVHDNELQHQLSDAWEFQENEVMKAGDKLRSIRSKLAVLEGKISLSMIDTQKLLEEKQRRIDSVRANLQLLRTTCVFWTHSASEVLLVGSYDGWTSQVKMEKTSTGIFSTSLRLYPGRYEIKFIVDGVWRVDPMLPVVRSNGYENNRLVVHE